MSKALSSKKILMISPHSAPNVGGIETHIRLLMESLARKSYDVTLLTYQPLTTHITAPSREEDKNTYIRRFGLLGNHVSALLDGYPALNVLYLSPYLFIRSLFFMLKNHKNVDIIHAFGLNAGLVARILAFVFRKPIVLTTKGIHGFYRGSLPGNFIAWILNGMDTIMLGSLDSKDDYLNLGIEQTKFKVFSHWTDKHQNSPDRKALGWEKAFTAIYVGRLIPQKGIPLIINLARTMPMVQFKIIGDGLLRDDVINADKELSNFSYLGVQTPDMISTFLSAADVFIYPINYREDASIAVIESLAHGAPVISSYQGSGEYQLSEKVGIVTSPELRTFTTAIKKLQNDPELLSNMSSEAKRYASKFMHDGADQIIQIYDDLK